MGQQKNLCEFQLKSSSSGVSKVSRTDSKRPNNAALGDLRYSSCQLRAEGWRLKLAAVGAVLN